jgi:putative Flp pilus-assembly TadE/G-like protein
MMCGRSGRRDQHGMITLWILGLTISIMFLGGIGLDLWRAIAVRREVSMMADAAATAGANGLDESALRGGTLSLDASRVRQLVDAELVEYPGSPKLIAEEVTVVGAQVNVTLRENVPFSLLGIFMGRGKFVVQASATAQPQEIP